MKKLLLAAAMIFALSGLKAQEGQNALKVNPLSLFFITGNVAYERQVAENQSAQLGVFFSGFTLSDIRYTGIGITPEYRFYFAGNKKAMDGIYVGPFVRYQSYTLKDKDSDSKARYSSFGGGAVLGWEKSFSSNFVLDIFFGPAYNSGKVTERSGGETIDVSDRIDGFGLRTGVTLGFRF